MHAVSRLGWLAVLVVACSPSSADEISTATGSKIIGGAPASAAYPEAAYVDIDMSATSGYACSAVLIAPKVVLTAGHCVDTHSRWDVHVGSQVRTSRSAITYDWNEGGAQVVNPNHHDLGLVFLDTAIAIAQYPTIANAKVADGTKVLDVGRVNDGVLTNQLYGAPTNVSDATRVGYPFDYVAKVVIQSGDSGGPVFEYGTHKLLAINSGAGSEIEVLARVDLLESWLRAQVDAHGGGGSFIDPDPKPVDPPPVKPSCGGAEEAEPDDSFATAMALGSGKVCGSIATAGDEDWFYVSAGAGALTLELTGTGDARFAVGVVDGVRCVAALEGLKQLSLSSSTPQKLCVHVASPSRTTQTYELSRR